MGGENLFVHYCAKHRRGSSPRGRGKRRGRRGRARCAGLIPAWAGKTFAIWFQSCVARAHPRVGGENYDEAQEQGKSEGSSPRGRGKPGPCNPTADHRRLIPAWAGKTPRSARYWAVGPAHPRVGGENETIPHVRACVPGSSPRGRGKPSGRTTGIRVRRLIPAWAGKTLTCAFIERIGQILETLELAVSSESYTLSAAYATDAPQDQARNTALVLPSSRGAS